MRTRKNTVKLLRDFPELAAQWHPTRNSSDLETIRAFSTEVVWWKCDRGSDHEWTAQVKGRVCRQSACPFCANKRVSSSNSLATLRPDLVSEWRDSICDPTQVMCGTNIKVELECVSKHRWKASVINRAVNGSGCPFCSGNQVTIETALATTHPMIAAEWHPTRNAQLTPEQVTTASGRRVWWQCRTCSHEWQTSPSHRTFHQQGCPKCNHPRRKIRTEFGRHLEQRLADYKRSSPRRGHMWELTDEQARDLLVGACHYCGFECDPLVKSNGIDRIDNTLGYTQVNTVSCCVLCNQAKHTMTLDDFRLWVDRLARHQGYTK